MAKGPNLVVSLVGDVSNLARNLRKAQGNLTGFERFTNGMSKRVNRTLGTVGSYFALRNITRFAIESAKAAGEDKRAQVLLADQLKRTAKAKDTDIAATEAMISRMELATGVADDDLRPAMVKLVTVTRNTRKAQDLLKLSLGASAKTGKPLEVVATAIAKAFAGQTTSLFRLLPNLKQSKDWMADLATETKGLAAQQADPFEKINRFFDRIKESLGGPLNGKLNKFVSSFIDADFAKIGTDVDGVAVAFGNLLGAFGGGDQKLGFLNIIEGVTDTIRLNVEAITTSIQLLTGQKFTETPGITKFAQGAAALFGQWAPPVTAIPAARNRVNTPPQGAVTINISTKDDTRTTMTRIDAELKRRGLRTVFGSK